MNDAIVKFLNDYLSLETKGMHQYIGAFPPSITSVHETVIYIKSRPDLLNEIIDETFTPRAATHRLIQMLRVNEHHYEVFVSERLSKGVPESFDNQDDALLRFIEILFDNYGICTADSKIYNLTDLKSLK